MKRNVLKASARNYSPPPEVFPIKSIRKLEALLGFDRRHLMQVADHAGRYYKSFDQRPFGSNKKWRHIDNPTGDVRAIQKRIQTRVLKHFAFPDTMLGGVTKGTIIENARRHSRQKVVFALDIRNCFPSTNHTQVFGAYRDRLECSTVVARLLTRLTTFQTRLPQGAATSSLLANLVLLDVHDEIRSIAQDYGFTFTFYVDDIVLSGASLSGAIEPVIRAIQRHGFSAPNKKKSMMRGNEVQKVTGLVVNKKVNIAGDYVEGLRRDIIRASKEGFFTENEERSFLGRINYVGAVNRRIGRKLRTFYDQFGLCVKGDNATPKYERRPCKCAKRHMVSRG